MRIVELIGMFREYIFLAVVGLLAMAVLIGAGYFIVYKKFLRYSMIMAVITLRKNQRNRYRKAFAYFSPFLVTVLIFVVMFTYYNLKEFGNLAQAYDYKLNMKNMSITSTLDFSRSEKTAPVYKAPTLNKDSSLKFAIDFFENLNIDTSDIEIMDYYTEAVYWSRENNGNKSHNIWLNNLDSSYSYTDFSSRYIYWNRL